MPTQPGGVGSLHANRSAAGRSNPTQAEFSGATTTKRQKTAVCFGHIAMEQESRRRTCAARRMAGPVIFPVSRKVSTRVGVRPGVFSERRRPLAAAQASCDWLQSELHDGHPRGTVGGARAAPSRTAPTTKNPRGDCTEPLTLYCATQGHCGHHTYPLERSDTAVTRLRGARVFVILRHALLSLYSFIIHFRS